MLDGRSDNAYARIAGDHHQSIANGNLRASNRLSEYYYTLRMKHIGRLNTYIDNIDAPYVEDESVRDRYENILKGLRDRKSTRLNSSHVAISYAVFCLKKKIKE